MPYSGTVPFFLFAVQVRRTEATTVLHRMNGSFWHNFCLLFDHSYRLREIDISGEKFARYFQAHPFLRVARSGILLSEVWKRVEVFFIRDCMEEEIVTTDEYCRMLFAKLWVINKMQSDFFSLT